MSDETDNQAQNDGDSPDLIKGKVKHSQISARVPEHVARGAFSTGAIVLVGNNEFIMDFVVRMAQPHQVASRVVIPHAVMPQLIGALRTNLDKYRDRFGDPPEMPKGDPDARRPTIEEVYDELKLPDDDLSGAYANAVMISHSPAEFCFDFITNFFPRSSVSARVYVSATQVPRMLDAISHTYEEFKKRVIAQQHQRRQQMQQQIEQADGPIESPYYPPKTIDGAGGAGSNEQIVGPDSIGGDNEIITGPDEKPDPDGDEPGSDDDAAKNN